MNDQTEGINGVLAGFMDVTTDHPAAQQLLANVAALKVAELDAADNAADDDPYAIDAITVEVLPALVIRPGDVLVLSTTDHITLEQLDRIKAEIFRRLPNIADVVMLGRVSISGVYREDTEP